MPVPPALLLNRSSFSPEYSPPSPYLSHAAPAIQSIPIAHLTPSPMTFPTLNPSPPPLTSGSDYNTPTLQTPFDTAGPSRVIMVDPSASPSPAPVVEIKSFPHAADLLGAPSEGSSSRRSTPVRGTESVEEDRSTQQFAEPIASPQSAARAVQERLARVRERIAARRAERAVEDMSHRRSHSRHIFDPESPTAMSFDPVRGAAGDVGRIAPRTRAVRDDGADRAAENHRWRMMAAAQRNTDQPRPIHSEYQPTTIHPEDQPFAATATASTAAASTARAYHAEPQPVHGAFIRQQPSYLSAEPEFAFIDQSLNPNSYVSGPNSDTGPSPFLQAQPEPTVPAPRPPLSFGWESEDRPPTLFRRSQPGWTTHRPLSSTLPPPNAPYASHDHQNSGISQSARARALRERLVQLDELRAVSRPQHIEEDWLSRPPWWNAGGDPNVPRIPASAPFAEFNRSNRLRETDPPQTPTEFRTPHSRWLSAESNADNAARPDRSVVDRWNRSVQQAVDRRLPLEPQRDLRMAQHLGHDFSSARLSALSTAVPEMTSIAQRNLEFEHGAEMLRHRLAAAAGPGGDWDEVWGELRMPVDSIYTGLHDPHTLRNLSESARTARLDRADTTSGFHQGGNTAVPPSRSAPSHPYLRHRQYLAEAAARRQDEINIPLLPRSNNAQAGWSNWREPDMAEDYLDMMDGDFAYPQPIGIPGVANPEQGYRYRHLSACPVARASLSFRPDMTEEEKRHVVKMVASSVTRLGSAGRRKMAESVVKSVKFEVWGREGSGTEMVEKEMFCSVCHDEYEDDSEVAVTPCAHMYHKDCLDIWVQQPNISSCPMCRRDLAVLACVQKMVPGKSRDEAVELWKLV